MINNYNFTCCMNNFFHRYVTAILLESFWFIHIFFSLHYLFDLSFELIWSPKWNQLLIPPPFTFYTNSKSHFITVLNTLRPPFSLPLSPTLVLANRSLGVLTYVLLTGFLPFGGDNDQETFLQISKGELDFPAELFEDISPEAIDFMKRLLLRQPEWVAGNRSVSAWLGVSAVGGRSGAEFDRCGAAPGMV